MMRRRNYRSKITQKCSLSLVIACLLGAGAVPLSSPVTADAAKSIDSSRCKPGEPTRVVAFGDSLTAGYGLPQSAAFPVQLEKELKSSGHKVVVANAGVSGDTTSGGLARFNWAVPPNTDAVILELGANDALRGSPPQKAHDNLDKIIAQLKARNVAVLLTGMRALRNWGGDYEAAFNPIFEKLSAKHNVLLYPFFLEGVALDSKLNLSDGLHPNALGIQEIVKRILPKVEDLLKRASSTCTQAANAAHK